MSRPDEDFLSRWSARKLQARAAPEPEIPAALPDPAPPADTVPEKSEAEILDELGLPDPDSLVKGDDFKAFLGAGIPAQLRARALRRLWLSDPVLANLDGLNDYDQDFTDKATVRPDLKTAYRVGKGILRQPPQAGTAAVDAPSPPRDEHAAESGPEIVTEAVAADVEHDASPPAGASAGDTSGPAGLALADEVAREAASPAVRPRRMRFRFETG